MQGLIPKVLDDILALRPTLFCAVPRVFDRIHAGIYEQVSWLLRWHAMNARLPGICCLKDSSTRHRFLARPHSNNMCARACSELVCQGRSVHRACALLCVCVAPPAAALTRLCLLLQLQKSLIKRLVFQICLWVKSFMMKRGVKHDKVTARCHLLGSAGSCCRLLMPPCRHQSAPVLASKQPGLWAFSQTRHVNSTAPPSAEQTSHS